MRFLRPAIVLTLILAGCGGADEPTPTQPPPGDPPGLEKTVGAVMIAFVQGYDLATGQPGGTDFTSTVIGAGFIDPNAEGSDTSPTTLPGGVPLPSGGFATDTCTPVDLTAFLSSDAKVSPAQTLRLGVALAMPEEEEAGSLVSVGPQVDVMIGASPYPIPLVEDEDLPPALAEMGLSPIYFLGAEGIQEDVYNPEFEYGIRAPGGDSFPAFEAAPFFRPPARLLVESPAELLDGGGVSRGEDLEFVWSPGDGNFVVIDLHLLTGEGVSCVVVDDGSFSIPASQLETLPAGDALLTQARFTTADTEIRLNERLMGVGAVSITAQITLN